MNRAVNKNFILDIGSFLLLKILLVFFCFLVSGNIYSQNRYGWLEGKIIDKENNSVLSLVNLKLEALDRKEFYETKSDVSGNYRFRNLREGIYDIKANHIGYKEYSHKISIQNDKSKSLDIFLQQTEIEIEKINVTSTKTEITLQQTPSSIVIVNSNEIKKKNIITFDNILEEVQGITINRSSGINVNSLSIRGSSDVAGGGIGTEYCFCLTEGHHYQVIQKVHYGL